MREGRRCWICGKETSHLEAHEFWAYDDENHVQKLLAIHHLCVMCHKIKHLRFWCYTEDGKRKLEGEGLSKEDLIKHFCKINGCSREGFDEHMEEAFRIWKERSEHKWRQDFGKYDPRLGASRREEGSAPS